MWSWRPSCNSNYKMKSRAIRDNLNNTAIPVLMVLATKLLIWLANKNGNLFQGSRLLRVAKMSQDYYKYDTRFEDHQFGSQIKLWSSSLSRIIGTKCVSRTLSAWKLHFATYLTTQVVDWLDSKLGVISTQILTPSFISAVDETNAVANWNQPLRVRLLLILSNRICMQIGRKRSNYKCKLGTNVFWYSICNYVWIYKCSGRPSRPHMLLIAWFAAGVCVCQQTWIENNIANQSS